MRGHVRPYFLFLVVCVSHPEAAHRQKLPPIPRRKTFRRKQPLRVYKAVSRPEKGLQRLIIKDNHWGLKNIVLI